MICGAGADAPAPFAGLMMQKNYVRKWGKSQYARACAFVGRESLIE